MGCKLMQLFELHEAALIYTIYVPGSVSSKELPAHCMLFPYIFVSTVNMFSLPALNVSCNSTVFIKQRLVFC